MRRRGRVGIAVGVLGAVGVAAVVLVGTIADVVIGGAQQAAGLAYQNTSCDASLGPFTLVDATSGGSAAASLTSDQQSTVAQIIAIGKQRKLPPLAWQVAIQAGMQESGLRDLPYGDRDSLGIFQMRPSQGWGAPAQLLDVTYAIGKFYDVLAGVPNWQQQPPGETAQDIERSAFPLAYNHWTSLAAFLVQHVGQVTDPTGCGASAGIALPTDNQAAAKAIAFALAQIGKPYVWGATGPDSFDCSGLMLRAYQAAGINLPRVSGQQFTAGALLPVHNAQPGDLMFLAYNPSDPSTIHHVFMYLGGNQVVEAPYQGHPVHVRAMDWNDPELVQQAVRPGV
ncbi:MAG TPA: C40 family peptidase [Pseudonocardiaceae bacterium]|jgi:cell wall-associated NlpC family hydrolase|nr:C40 family peptidase [Pseudonocardiaceae bacterium]